MPADVSDAISEKAESSPKPKTLGVVIVHGIGAQQRGATLIQVGRALLGWLSNWLKDWKVEVLDTTLTTNDGDPAAPPHAQLVFRGRDMSSPHIWVLAESYWADCFPPPTYGQFVRWTLTVIPVAILQHLSAQFRPQLDIGKETRRAAASGRMPFRAFLRLVPHELPRLREQLLDLPDERFTGLRWRALLRSYSSWLVLPGVLVAGLAMQLLLILMLIPAALPIASVRSFARWIQLVLSATIGDSYLFVSSPVTESAIVSKVQRDIEWIAKRCDQVVVVAHSQGAAVAYEAIEQWTWRNRLPEKLKLLITFGSGLQKLFELKSIQRGTAWSRPPRSTFISTVMAVTASALIAWLVVLLFFGTVSLLFAVVATLVLYFVAGSSLHVAAEQVEARPSLLKVPWDDFYASHDPVPNGSILLKQEESADDGKSIREVAESDPVIAFYLRQREVTNRRSSISDHTTYWEGLDDFVARVVTRLLIISDIRIHSLTAAWLDTAGDRRQWRVRLLSSFRATAATAGVSVFVWISHTSGFLDVIGPRTLALTRNALAWMGFSEQFWRIASAIHPAWIGAVSLGVGIAVSSAFLYFIGRIGWDTWERRELRQFYYRMGYEPGLIGPGILALAWLSLVLFPLAASALLESSGLAPASAPWWIATTLMGVSVFLVWTAGAPPGSSLAWVLRVLADGESLLAGAGGEMNQLREAAFRMKMGAIVLGRKNDPSAHARAVQGLAGCLEQMNSLDIREWELLKDASKTAMRRLARAGHDASAVKKVLDNTQARITELRDSSRSAEIDLKN